MIATDARCRALAKGLLQLSRAELERLYDVLLSDPDSVVVDSCNFDPVNGTWCPLAIALGVPEIARRGGEVQSDAAGKRLILEIGRARHGDFSLNPLSGVPGDFYREDRHADLTELVRHLLQ